ncbi:IS3 family transposase [Paenibacillus sp. Marseille-Q9583]
MIRFVLNLYTVCQKKEFVYCAQLRTKKQAYVAISNSLNFYNCKRIHGSLGYVLPVQFGTRFKQIQQNYFLDRGSRKQLV